MNGEASSQPLISFHHDEPILSIRDELADVDYDIEFPTDPQIETTLTAQFHFPVDAAIAVTCTELVLSPNFFTVLRDETGTVLGEPGDLPTPLQPGTYFLDITGRVKTYLRLPDTVPTLTYQSDPYEESAIVVSFPDPTTVSIGARSLHPRPAATIVVPDTLDERAAAISHLGSAIKEFSPERSWPTLRGHPPRIIPGDALHIPADLEPPDTGIRVTVPPSHANLYRVAPLAFYFGATIELGDPPAMHLPNGYTEPLETRHHSLEDTITELVGKCFLLDVLARQDGYIPAETYTYPQVAPHLSFIPEQLATEPLHTQLMEYLEAPTTPILNALPRWTTTAVLRPSPGDIQYLPYLLDALARIRVATHPPSVTELTNRDPSTPYAVAYTHPNVPNTGVALHPAGFTNRLQTAPPRTTDASVAILTTDPERTHRLRQVLDTNPLAAIPATLDITTNPTRTHLRELWASTDLLLSDLPSTHDRIRCSDGWLPLDTHNPRHPKGVLFDATHVDTKTRHAAVDAGAVSVLATPELLAVDTCLPLLGCLLCGHPLETAAALTLDDTPYMITGAPMAELITPPNGTRPGVYRVTTTDHGYQVSAEIRPTAQKDLGTTFHWTLYDEDGYHLDGTNPHLPDPITADELADLFDEPHAIVILDGDTHPSHHPHPAHSTD